MLFLLLLCFYIFFSLGNYSESGTTSPVGMSVIFIIHILVSVFGVLFVCGICVYCFASIKPTALIILNLDIYQEKKIMKKKNRNEYTKR